MSYKYPRAGKNAPGEVKGAIARWRKLPEIEKQDEPLLYWLLGAGTPDYKMDGRDADYTEVSRVKNERCGNCVFAFQHVITGRYICSQIEGDIAPKGWCRFWEA